MTQPTLHVTTSVCGYKIENSRLWKAAVGVGALLCALGILGALGLAQHYGALNCGDGFASLIGKITVPPLGIITGCGIFGFVLAILGLYKLYKHNELDNQFTALQTQIAIDSDAIKKNKQNAKTFLDEQFVTTLNELKTQALPVVKLLTDLEEQDRLDNNQVLYLLSGDHRIFVRKMDDRYCYFVYDITNPSNYNNPAVVTLKLALLEFTFPQKDRNGQSFPKEFTYLNTEI